MIDKRPELITFEKGLLESQESSLVPPGYLTRCVNWVPEPSGALRARGKWFKGTETGAPTTRANLGIGMFSRLTDPSIVQQSTVYHAGPTVSGTFSPLVTWATPTIVGNTLVAFIDIACGSAVSLGFTSTGWTARHAVVSPTSTTMPACGVYDLVTTTSYSGDFQPFSITCTGSQVSIIITILEVAGITTFEEMNNEIGTSSGAPSSPIFGTTCNTVQASELVLGFVSAQHANATNPALTLSTTSTGWTELWESTGYDFVSTTHLATGAIYYSTPRTTGAQTLLVDGSWVDEAFDSIAGQQVSVSYKGWNTSATPGDTGAAYLMANNDGATYDIFSVDRDSLAAGTFTALESNVGDSTAGAPVAFALGLGATWYTAPSFTAVRQYTGSTPAAVAGSPSAARCLAVHKERLWVGAGTRLSYSQVGNGTIWTGRGSSYFEIGRDDGEPLEDVVSFADGLVISKRTSAHFLVGDDPSSFAHVQLRDGGGAPGRSLLATNYGCIMAGREVVYLFDGANVQPISRGIESTYGVADGDFVSLAYADGCCYIADGGKGYVFVYDFVSQGWHLEQIGDVPGEAAAVLFSYGETQLQGPVSSTVGSLLNYRNFPHPVRGKDYDSLAMVYDAATGDLWPSGPKYPITLRNMWLQTRQRDGAEDESNLAVRIDYDDGSYEEGVVVTGALAAPRVRRQRLDFGSSRGVGSMKLSFSHEVPTGQTIAFDIEAVMADYDRSAGI